MADTVPADTVPTVTVTIGRNIGDAPMPDGWWEAFKSDVTAALDRDGVDVWVNADYVGNWEDVTEEAHVWHGENRNPADNAMLEHRLAVIRKKYEQDAIGLAFGKGQLV